MNQQIENHRMLNCLWLLRILQRYRRMTLTEIREQWAKRERYLNQTLARQTFVDLRLATEEFLGIEIGCDRRTNEYYIADKGDPKAYEWMISSFSISSLVREQQDVRDRILLEAPPRGIEHFDLLIEAFRNGYALEMKYRKFSDSMPYTCFIEPYCLKHDQQRWYLLARKDHRSLLQTFALDRILELKILKDCPFTPEESFSPRLHFAHSFGVYVGDKEPATIRIRAYGTGRDYLRTAPLHESQSERIVSGDISDFTIECRPTRDLMLHLLGQGANVEVMEPESFREEIAQEAKRIAARYE